MSNKISSISWSQAFARLLLLIIGGSCIYLALTQGFSAVPVVLLLIISIASAIILLNFKQLNIVFSNFEFNALRGDSASDLETSGERFEAVLRIADEESERISSLLKRVYLQRSSSNPFDDLSIVIEQGLKFRNASPAALALDISRQNISSKRYLNEFSETQMKVVRIEGNKIFAKSEEKGEFLKEGMEFRVYKTDTSVSGQQVEEYDPRIGVAQVTLASKRTTEMEMITWDLEQDSEEIKRLKDNQLKDENISVDIIVSEDIREAELEDLIEAKNNLENALYGGKST